jgi:fumagillin biosynthesis dioxygenase
MGIVANQLPEKGVIEAARDHLKKEGWAIVPNVLSETEASHVLKRLWAAKEASAARGESTHLPHLDPNESNVRVFYLLELDEIFRELIAHPSAISLVQDVLGPQFLISNFTANIARPGSKSMALHSDQSIVVPPPWHESWALNVIWCLSDVHKDNGATLFIPGSNQYKTQADVPTNAPDLLVPFEAKAGSIILMDGRVWHTSGSNITESEERALLFGYYTKGFLRQQVNWTARLSDVIKEGLPEELKEWLGLGVAANTGRAGDIVYNYLEKQYPKKELVAAL